MSNQNNQLALLPSQNDDNESPSNNSNKTPSSGQPSGSEPTQKNKRYQKKKKHTQFNKKNRSKKKVSSFKGTITEMNGHVFQCQSERPIGNQFLRSIEELKSYVSIKISN